MKDIMDLKSEIAEEKQKCNETLSTYQQQAAQANAFKREADDAAKEKPMLAGIGVNVLLDILIFTNIISMITGGAAGLVAGLVVGVLGARAVGKMMEARRRNQEEEDEEEDEEEEDKVPITVVTEPSEEQKADTLDTVT